MWVCNKSILCKSPPKVTMIVVVCPRLIEYNSPRIGHIHAKEANAAHACEPVSCASCSSRSSTPRECEVSCCLRVWSGESEVRGCVVVSDI